MPSEVYLQEKSHISFEPVAAYGLLDLATNRLKADLIFADRELAAKVVEDMREEGLTMVVVSVLVQESGSFF